jgi:hypothetical protein
MCVSVNVLDEVRSIELALTHLSSDAALRERLGRSARDWWSHRHTLEKMESDYEGAIERALDAPVQHPAALPAHFREEYSDLTRGILSEFGVDYARLFPDASVS